MKKPKEVKGVEVIYIFGNTYIYIEGILHIFIDGKFSVQSYRINNWFHIDYHTKDQGTIETNYGKRELWVSILKELDKHLKSLK